jgi:uncharacterized lipoprotein
VKRNPIHRIFIVAAIAAVLPACGLFHKKADYYSQAAEARPLEVPPDLDTPPTTNELAVPQAGTGAAAGSVSTSPVESLGATELRVAEDVAGTWRKVGAALDRAKVGTVSVRDENAHSYTVDFTGAVSTRPEGERHWYTPVLEHLGFGEDEKKEITRHVTVVVADDAGGSRVSVSSDGADRFGADSTRRVADVLRQNLAIAAAPVAAAPENAAAAPAAVAPMAPAASPASIAPPAAVGVSVAGSELVVSDGVENTYRRVGLALERAQIGTLSGRDEAAHTYTLDFNSTVETQPAPTEHHWYTRILHPFGGAKGKTETVRRSLTVRVGEASGGARVVIEGDTSDKSTADAAKRVIEVLRDRLS